MPRLALLLALALAVPAAVLARDAVSTANAAASGAAEWRWPVEGPILSTFRYGPDPFARGQRRGIRIGAPVGTAVRSACAGGVRFAGTAGMSGRVVSVVCGRWTATYLHLAGLSVRRGDAVERGQRVGAVGRSGRPRLRDSHLAFGVRRSGRRWDYVDPLALLPELPGAPPPALVPPARRNPPRLPPTLGPTPAPEPTPSPAPFAVPARAGARQPAPLKVAGGAVPGEEGSAPPMPLAAWIGLTALAVGLLAGPVRGRRRRRRRARGLTVTATQARRV